MLPATSKTSHAAERLSDLCSHPGLLRQIAIQTLEDDFASANTLASVIF